MDESTKFKDYFVRRFLTYALVFGFVLFLIVVFSFRLMRQDETDRIKMNQQQKIFAQKSVLEFSLDETILDLLTISRSTYFTENFLKYSGNKSNNFSELIKSLLQYKPNYKQLRFLDTLGMERFKAIQEDSKILLIEKKDLQDKSNRYYFKESLKLNARELYISPFDLNVEHEVIEKPYRPMIRVCVPVFDEHSKKVGIDVINYDGSQFMKRFYTSLLPGWRSDFLVNSDGYFLAAPDTSLLWGFMFPHKKDLTVNKIFPEDFDRIMKSDSAQFESPRGLFTVINIYAAKDVEGKFFGELYPKNYFWKVFSFVPHSELTIGALLPIKEIIVLISLTFAAGILVSLYFARLATRKYKVQCALIESEENLRISNKTKDRFFSILSHDLKNSTGSIYVFLEYLAENYDMFSEEEKKANLKDVSDAASQLNKLLLQILDWAKIQQGQIDIHPVEISARDLFQEQIDLVSFLLKNKDLRIEIDIEGECVVFADPNSLRTILRNLINNAIKYSYRDNRMVLYARSKASRVEIRVIDFGQGMSQADADKIFDLNTRIQTKGTEDEAGTGFGLKLVSELVRKNGGNIKAESSLGKGCSMILNFPSGK